MKKIPPELAGVLESTDDTLSGAVRFAGTRVSVEVFLDTMASGWSLDQTLASFPTLDRQAALAVLEWQNDQARHLLGLTKAA
jgi:uncharacterized protein (DUF433 family)